MLMVTYFNFKNLFHIFQGISIISIYLSWYPLTYDIYNFKDIEV